MLDKWFLVHAHRRLVRRQIVAPLMCPECQDTELNISIDKDDDPIFVCWECASTFKPGMNFYDAVREAL
jgi:hypothetical protein